MVKAGRLLGLAILDPDIFTKIIYVVVFAIVLIMLVTKLLPLLKI